MPLFPAPTGRKWIQKEKAEFSLLILFDAHLTFLIDEKFEP
ncbi:hypothetical protein HBHAL_2845 [Halobacillus halophilus DSM 2266]|uniref:Uncharacterized protein n=1 Tax=Halobacillus halophilus (strain ATCC 35676 / DSM 2266 / JCM 20832 / KCTC 3685 / LMG 17431 / NBRC 102448 / NCIMB 2269) TaxID=866895 RepID=I0JM23_HALH3|nr:hypothetical protein HBHAL_2845 [Halobacillus halophilus DSM 2266]